MIKINKEYIKNFINEEEFNQNLQIAEKSLKHVQEKNIEGNELLGWYDLPINYDKEEFKRIINTSKKIKKMCDIFIVIGIGGSYLGARAAIEFIKTPYYNNIKKNTPDIYFAGNNISSSSLSDLIKICEGHDICVNVISKSGTTTEPAIAFRIFKKILEEKYGIEGARERIFVTTDKNKGKLKELSDTYGYETFIIPENIGGRYSVLTSVGMLPISVAGIDINQIIKGATKAREEYLTINKNNSAITYATIRNILYNKGKSIEILVSYEPALQMLCEWWKQLFGESEGKNHKGLYPSSVIYSTDLHSLGQYVQDGQRILFETVISFNSSEDIIEIPDTSDNFDDLNYLSGKKLDYINSVAMKATLLAHNDGEVPNIVIELPDRSAYTFGQLVYFFELSCAISGYMINVNPFNQPGVEKYKNNMYALLNKPGYKLEK